MYSLSFRDIRQDCLPLRQMHFLVLHKLYTVSLPQNLASSLPGILQSTSKSLLTLTLSHFYLQHLALNQTATAVACTYSKTDNISQTKIH